MGCATSRRCVGCNGQFAEWRKQRSRIVAPDHWVAECVSAIRRTVHSRIVSAPEGRVAIQDLFALDVEIVPTTERQCLAALEWAERLGQARAYDGLYCALAEALHAEFWTADRRLARTAQQGNAAWGTLDWRNYSALVEERSCSVSLAARPSLSPARPSSGRRRRTSGCSPPAPPADR